jgi:hypothetical protein
VPLIAVSSAEVLPDIAVPPWHYLQHAQTIPRRVFWFSRESRETNFQNWKSR